MQGRPLDGRVLVQVLEAYVQSVNQGAVMDVQSVWTHVLSQERDKLFGKAEAFLEREFGVLHREMPFNED